MKGLWEHEVSRRSAIAALTSAAALVGMSGCTLFVPSLEDAPSETASQAVDDALLVTPATLTVAVDYSDAPQSMDNGDGPEGYAVDVARAMAEHLGLAVAMVQGTSPSNALPDGSADVFLGATSSAPSGDDISVFGNYLEDATAVFGMVDADAPTPSLSEISQGVVGVQESSASQEAATRAGLTGTQETYTNVNECFEALAAGTVDYVVCNATAGAYLSRAYAGTSFVGTLSSITPYGAAVLTSASDLQQVLSDCLSELSDDGTLDAIHSYWYGSLPFSLSDTAIAGATIASDAQEAGGSGADETGSADGGDDASSDAGKGSEDVDAAIDSLNTLG